MGCTKAARQLDIPVKPLADRVDAAHAGRPARAPQRKPVDGRESEMAQLRAAFHSVG